MNYTSISEGLKSNAAFYSTYVPQTRNENNPDIYKTHQES